MSKWKKSLKRISVYSILLFLLIGFIRCQFIIDIFTEDTSIAPEILPFFEEGDTIIFKCNQNVDSFYVEKAIFYAVGEGETDLGYERFMSKIIQINCEDSCYEFRSTIRPWEYSVTFKGFEFFSYRITENDKKYYGFTRKIGDYHLTDLYRTYDFEADSITGKEIIEMFYSKKYGVVEYRLTNNDIFQIGIESLEMLMARE